jgi:ankyrin repeat protein
MFGRYYGSKSCQTSDWINHKHHHKILASSKDGVESAIDRLKSDVSCLPLQGVDAENKNSNGMTEVLLKASDGDWRAVERLLLAGSNATVTDDQGFTALHWASFFGHVEVARLLIANGPAGIASKFTPEGVSCLHLASQNEHVEVVRALAEADTAIQTQEASHACILLLRMITSRQ